MCNKPVLPCSVSHHTSPAMSEWRGKRVNAHPVRMSLRSEPRRLHILRSTCRSGICSAWQCVWLQCKGWEGPAHRTDCDFTFQTSSLAPWWLQAIAAQSSSYLPLSCRPHKAQRTRFHGRPFLENRWSPRGSGKWLSLLPPLQLPQRGFLFFPPLKNCQNPFCTVQLTPQQAMENDVNLNFCLIK